MTSRRSRLKAVANLPVRRKTQVLPESNCEPVPADHVPSDKPTADKDKVNDTVDLIDTCQNHETEKGDNIQIGNKEETLTCNNNNNNATTNFKNSFTEEIVSNLNELETSGSNNNNNNSNDSNKTCNVVNNKSFSASTFKSRKHFKPNLVSSSAPKKTQSSEEVSNDSEKPSAENVFLPPSNIQNKDQVEEGVKSYTVLDLQTPLDTTEPTYTITPLTPYDNSAVDDVYAPEVTQEFEEVQLYTELEEPIEFFMNLPKVVNNEICESSDNLIESEQEEPVFTTLVNCTVNKEIENYKRTNSSNFVNSSNDGFVKPTAQSIPVNGKVGGSDNVIPRRERLTSATDSDFFSPNSRRSVSTFRRKRSKCSDSTKKLADARREFQKKYEKSKPDRSSLKMIDLIFYNPATNPMESKSKSDRRESLTNQGEIQELLAEERVDEPEAMDSSLDLTPENDDTENTNKMPVPQVKIGQNGEIILDEKSLVIETTEAKKGREDLQNSIPIFEDRGSKVSYYRGKSKKTRDWTDFETKRFYKALNTIGPDFSLMQKYFPKRSRLELKNKFKREERLNRHLIDKALNNPSEFDMTLLEKDLAVEKKAEEDEIEMRLCRRVREKPAIKRSRVKSSLLSREMVESDNECENNQSQVETVSAKKSIQNEKTKKKKEINFIFQKIFLKKANDHMNELSDMSTSPDLYRPTEHGVT